MGVRFLKVAVIYFAVGVALGLYMSMAHDYSLRGVHTHINLLGWVSFALAGIIYHLFPRAGENRLAAFHFWAHTIGLPVMMVSLFFVILGYEAFSPLVPFGTILVSLSIFIFVINVLKNVRTRVY
ncbi:cytochrome-c oxidase [Alteribacter populi]|uniref:cytochrome-c oxidase n=1 Tax=Alteribacter populi TaxID=2011011 RepID=UPI000BBA5E3B|nr:cytochrome-c oxidase [Alteribacter populi]